MGQHIDNGSPMEWIHAALAVVRDGETVLMLRRREDDRSYPGTWALPGGRIDPGESAREAIEREVLEETGLRVTVTDQLGVYDSPLPRRNRTYRITVFDTALKSLPGQLMAYPSEEHAEARWMSPAQALGELELSGEVTRQVLEVLSVGS